MLFELDDWTKQMNFSVFAGVASGLVIYWTQVVIMYFFEGQSLNLSVIKICISFIVAFFCLIIFMLSNAFFFKKDFKNRK